MSVISIIVPVYNCGKVLERCLNSIKSQTYKKIEVILVDDGSTDNSGRICRAFAEGDSRFQYIYQENRGAGEARNRGLERASGEYISFVDADDYIEEEYCQVLLEVLKKTGVSICDCQATGEYPDGTLTESFLRVKEKCSSREIYRMNSQTYEFTDRLRTHLSVWGKLFKAECVRELRFSERLFVGEDTLFFIQALKRAENMALFNYILYHYVVYEESAFHGKKNARKLTELDALEAVCKELPENVSSHIHYAHRCSGLLKALFIEKADRSLFYKVCGHYLTQVGYLVRYYKETGRYGKILKHKSLAVVCRFILLSEK